MFNWYNKNMTELIKILTESISVAVKRKRVYKQIFS